jgi:acetyltransferase
MSTRNLDKIFKPQRIAVIGATPRPKSVGATVLDNLLNSGSDAVVYPINPKHEAIHGIHAWRNIREVPKTPDLAIICIPAASVAQAVRECGEAGVGGIIILSAGFREVGAKGRELEQQIADEARKFPGLRIIGPNCLGVIVPGHRLNASFAGTLPLPGHVAFISQSGALCTAILDWADQKGLGFSYFVSIGNMLDVDLGDLIDYFGRQPEVRSIILYAESVTSARKFMSAARAFARIKPIVAYKSGRFAESAKAAASHTGAMAGEDAVYDAAFERAGIERCYEIDDMFDCAELLARQRPPSGPRIAIVTNAGGPGVMAADALLARDGVLATLSPSTIEALNQVLPPYWSHGNPVDVLGDADAQRYAAGTELVLSDENVDGVLVVLTPQAMTDATATAEAVGKLAPGTNRPILAAWMGGNTVQPGIDRLNKAGIPTYENPAKAVRAFMHLVSYARNREILYEMPREIPVRFPIDRSEIQERFATAFSHSESLVSEPLISETLCKAQLAAYGISTTRRLVAKSADEAVAAAKEIGFPIVMKILSPDISHKTDVGGVRLDLKNETDVRAAFEQITTSASHAVPTARIDGVSVQEMIVEPAAQELILGAKKDETFGAVLLLGMGGITAELLKDRVLELPPLNERLAHRMLTKLRCWPLLQGYRGRPGVDIDQLIEVLIRFSYLIADSPQIKEFDINPLIASPKRIVALDARAVLDRNYHAETARPFQHLAIRPYPEGFNRLVTLNSGLEVLLRPIRPEDEKLWHELIASCSFESIHARFGYSFKGTTHEMGARFCFIDYDREMAIIAEVAEGDSRKLIGVARLVADPAHETGEYAVLVGDDYHHQGLGLTLTEYCVEVARIWGLKRVVATTEPTNFRMLATFRHLNFELADDTDEKVIRASKSLDPMGTAR